MKKLFLVLALAFAGIFTANAQVWVGGGLGASIQKNNMSFSIAPEVGYAINNHWQVALGAGYGFNQTKVDVLGETITTNTNTLALQPYVRSKNSLCFSTFVATSVCLMTLATTP